MAKPAVALRVQRRDDQGPILAGIATIATNWSGTPYTVANRCGATSSAPASVAGGSRGRGDAQAMRNLPAWHCSSPPASVAKARGVHHRACEGSLDCLVDSNKKA